MNRRKFIKLACGFSFGSVFCLDCFSEMEKTRPNIVFFLADDMGWMDSDLYGSEYYKLPNLKRLAKKGMMFTNAYSANPLCSPTRASIMTGKYPNRLNMTSPSCHLPPLKEGRSLMPQKGPVNHKMLTPDVRRFLPLEEYTIGEAFRDAGYKTGFIGKWHLGLKPKHWPKQQGFDYDMGAPHPGPPSYFSPYQIETIPDGPTGEYITDRLTEEAVGFIQNNRAKPFFLALWHFAVHAPFQAKDDITRNYRDIKDPRDKQKSPVMASMLQSMDESLGKIMNKLQELGLIDNTVIVFVSDNGGNMYDLVQGECPTNNAPLRGGKGNTYEGGCRVPCVITWPGVIKQASKCDQMVTTVDLYPTLVEMADIEPNPKQVFDGVSIVPLLKGKSKLDRDAVFCHFPHYIPATQSIPNTWVRKGDWKLIRFYGEGPNRTNSYELYNLREDIGENYNLAAKYPEKVIQLDKLIDRFLKKTNTIELKPNPAYCAQLKCWQGSQDSGLYYHNGCLVLQSKGLDPYIYTYDVPLVSNAMRITFKMQTDIKGKVFFFYCDNETKGFSPNKRMELEMVAGDQMHQYTFDFIPRGTLKGLRIDPGSGKGEVIFDWIRLERSYSQVLKRWDFSEAL